MISRIILALALATTVLTSVSASARPINNCQEDLGFGRTSGWGCG
jgi:hypothetical protein